MNRVGADGVVGRAHTRDRHAAGRVVDNPIGPGVGSANLVVRCIEDAYPGRAIAQRCDAVAVDPDVVLIDDAVMSRRADEAHAVAAVGSDHVAVGDLREGRIHDEDAVAAVVERDGRETRSIADAACANVGSR